MADVGITPPPCGICGICGKPRDGIHDQVKHDLFEQMRGLRGVIEPMSPILTTLKNLKQKDSAVRSAARRRQQKQEESY